MSAFERKLVDEILALYARVLRLEARLDRLENPSPYGDCLTGPGAVTSNQSQQNLPGAPQALLDADIAKIEATRPFKAYLWSDEAGDPTT